MKIAVTVYTDSTYQAGCVIEALKHVRDIELDSYSGKVKIKDIGDVMSVGRGLDEDETITAESSGITQPVARPNINPGDPTIGKIGEATKALILDELGTKNIQPVQPKYTEHLKLLWKRGLIKFDGKEYYL